MALGSWGGGYLEKLGMPAALVVQGVILWLGIPALLRLRRLRTERSPTSAMTKRRFWQNNSPRPFQPAFSISLVRSLRVNEHEAAIASLLDSLRKAGVPEEPEA